ncbi:hypothetical protein [Lysinibacillus irui]|uniref:hypothetical protein n=1 Tax=Lysinibacillus irui TaxID=2998077 RepID=UPI002AD24E2C|nr:hypothetical protein [Lysinibacillus irui]MEA0565508.1 hypothetical protein [Lysinibacillus irui]
MVENEENVNELEENSTESTESTVTEDQTETTDQKEETSPSAEPVGEEIPELNTVQYTSELIETKNFSLQIDHHMTAGDMLVSMLLTANMAVMLLCRLLRDRK